MDDPGQPDHCRNRRLLTWAGALVVLVVVLVAVLPRIRYGYGWLETMSYYRYGGGETEYAARFTEEGWAEIKTGMKISEVKAILGEPLQDIEVIDREAFIWVYASPIPGGATPGHTRLLGISIGDGVTGTQSGFNLLETGFDVQINQGLAP